MMHTALVESHPASPADMAMTVAERLAIVKQGMKDVEAREFGQIGCFCSKVDMGKPVFVMACFVSKAPYLSLSIQSADEKHMNFEAMRGMLEKAAARRK